MKTVKLEIEDSKLNIVLNIIKTLKTMWLQSMKL